MKKITVLIIFLSITVIAFGQSGNGLWIGINANAGGSKLLPAEVERMKSQTKPVYGGGIEAGLMFNSHLGVFAGAGLSSYSHQLVPEKILLHGEAKIIGSNTYIEVPVGLRYVFFKHKGYTFFTHVGGKAAILISAKTEYRFLDPVTALSFYGTEHGSWQYNLFFVLPFLDLGINIPIGKFGLNVGPEVSYQLGNLYANPYFPYRVQMSLGRRLPTSDHWQANYFNVALKVSISLNGFH